MIKYPVLEEQLELDGLNSATPAQWDAAARTQLNPPSALEKQKVKSDGGSSSYYELPEDAKELQDLIEHKKMNYARANIFKAAYRIGDKDGNDDIYDLNKIIWFAERLLLDARRRL